MTSTDARVAQIADRIAKSTVTNPQPGTVLTTYAKAGEVVQPGQPLYKIADLDTLVLRAYVSESQLSSVRIGQQVQVHVDRGKGELLSLPGRVTWVSPQAEFTPTPIQTRDDGRPRVRGEGARSQSGRGAEDRHAWRHDARPAQMTPVSPLVVTRLGKRFGETVALDDVSLEVNQAELFGLVGPDGGGKTTLFRILTTLLVPDSGAATVLGLDVVRDLWAIRARVGYMPGRFSLYPDLSVEENLRFFASVFGTTIEAGYESIAPIYRQIEPFRERRAGALSGESAEARALVRSRPSSGHSVPGRAHNRSRRRVAARVLGYSRFTQGVGTHHRRLDSLHGRGIALRPCRTDAEGKSYRHRCGGVHREAVPTSAVLGAGRRASCADPDTARISVCVFRLSVRRQAALQ